MNPQMSPTNNLVAVQDYVTGRLSETDRRAFEDQLLSDSGLVRDLEETLRLREGLETLRERKILGQLTHPPRRAWMMRLALASAAASALIALGVTLWVERAPPVIAASVTALRALTSPPLMVVAHYSFAAVRDAASTPALALPTTGALELRALTPLPPLTRPTPVTPLADARQTFRVTLEAIHGPKASPIGFAEHLTPDADGFVAIYADASKLHPGDYDLSVETDAQDGTSAEHFAFTLKPVSGPTPERN